MLHLGFFTTVSHSPLFFYLPLPFGHCPAHPLIILLYSCEYVSSTFSLRTTHFHRRPDYTFGHIFPAVRSTGKADSTRGNCTYALRRLSSRGPPVDHQTPPSAAEMNRDGGTVIRPQPVYGAGAAPASGRGDVSYTLATRPVSVRTFPDALGPETDSNYLDERHFARMAGYG